ncbi:hypothetical protein MKX08_001759 [Trichoderma sp. CBMAI-0020]|nr:hypothetical protein MKX08_001759 [Trichoderma sp. CBMAI-0020]
MSFEDTGTSKVAHLFVSDGVSTRFGIPRSRAAVLCGHIPANQPDQGIGTGFGEIDEQSRLSPLDILQISWHQCQQAFNAADTWHNNKYARILGQVLPKESGVLVEVSPSAPSAPIATPPYEHND